MLGDDLSCTQLALSRPMASVSSPLPREMKGIYVHLSPGWWWAWWQPLCSLAGTSPDHPHQGSLDLPLQLMKHAAFTVKKTGEMGRAFSPTVVPPPVFCQEVSAAGRWGGWTPACPQPWQLCLFSHLL